MTNLRHVRLMQSLAVKLGAATILGLGATYAVTRRWSNRTIHNDAQDQNNKLMTIADAVSQSKIILQNIKDNSDCPGIAVAVSLNGKTIWQQGFGYANLENEIACTPHTVMKTASISKSVTSVLMGKLWEMDLLNLDENIQDYVKYWPQKYWKGDKVTLTVRNLASHRAGVRDYKPIQRTKGNNLGSSDDHQEFEYEEYYIKEKYKRVCDSVSLFKDDPLISEPGKEFHYTTHGYTLLSACLEGATGKDFHTLIRNMYKDMDMMETYLDDDKQQIIYNRSSHYVKNAEGIIENAPFTESSFKLAGAGMLSSGADLIKFASIILYSYQHSDLNSKLKSGYLQSDTVKLLWEPIEGTAVSWHQNGSYGMGWQIVPYNENEEFTFDDMLPSSKPEMNQKKRTNTESADIRCLVGHTGGTVGASCALLILPSMAEDVNTLPPRGVAVVILANLQGLSLGGIAARIAKLFDKCP